MLSYNILLQSPMVVQRCLNLKSHCLALITLQSAPLTAICRGSSLGSPSHSGTGTEHYVLGPHHTAHHVGPCVRSADIVADVMGPVARLIVVGLVRRGAMNMKLNVAAFYEICMTDGR